MTQAKSGDTVRIHYAGRFTDGTEFDSSAGREPLQFRIGSGEIIAGLDRRVAGMSVGDSRNLVIPAGEAYGLHDPEKVQSVPRSAVADHVDLRPGLQLQARTSSGSTIPLTVVEVGPADITVDANHPLAGRDLVFDVELVEILPAA
jgi:FKBP-type peptidyl-prolyl cis-trans isomerases 2